MIEIPKIKVSGASDRELLSELVKVVNLLGEQVQFTLMNIDAESVMTDAGVSLGSLIASGALKGEPGEQGPDGKVWRPTVNSDGVISWSLTDYGGITPAPQNIKGPPGPPGVVEPTWTDYATKWTAPPEQIASITSGAVFTYTYGGATRYRLVPAPYSSVNDAFYSGFNGSVLSGFLVRRG